MALPQVTGEFRAAADPELRFAPSGVAVCNIRAVASSRKKNDQNEWVDDKSCWLNLVGFKQVAENMAETFVKGSLMVVVGRISTDEYETREGEKRTSFNLVVDTIGPSLQWDAARILKAERSGGNGGGGGQSRQSAPADDPWAGAPPQEDEPPF